MEMDADEIFISLASISNCIGIHFLGLEKKYKKSGLKEEFSLGRSLGIGGRPCAGCRPYWPTSDTGLAKKQKACAARRDRRPTTPRKLGGNQPQIIVFLRMLNLISPIALTQATGMSIGLWWGL